MTFLNVRCVKLLMFVCLKIEVFTRRVPVWIGTNKNLEYVT